MSDLQFQLNKTLFNSKLPSQKLMKEQKSIISIIDKSLKHLNQISQANIVAQELYIQLLKEKKTMKFDQIKKIYLTLTQGKAKQILFQRDKQELIKTDYQNHEGLIRLCWRSIQKLIKKITYYMVNENHLSPISKSVLNLIQFYQKFVRRFQKVKNSSMLFVIQLMEKLIQQNSIMEKKIYDILLNRGYVVSLDQFYKLNGYDAQHRDAYEAKLRSDIEQNISDQQQKSPQIQTQNQHFSTNNKRSFTRKKKLFKFDNKNSWKQNLLLQNQQQKKSFPINKTNFQIRQSFEKFVGDFLQNQNLKEILINYKNQQETLKKRKNSQTKKKDELLNEEGLIQKKIFQNKIESVITQLKSNNIKINSKLLEIIDNSSIQAINSKLNQNERRLSERKNSKKRQSDFNAQKKIRESYMINDRKLVNQNLYRELLKRNKSIQNFITEEIDKDANKLQKQKQVTDPKQNIQDHIIQYSILEHNQNSTLDLKKISRFSKSLENKTFMFKSHQKFQKQNKYPFLGRNTKFLQNSLGHQNNTEEKRKIEQLQGNKSLVEKIRIAKEQWSFKNQKDILEAIQRAQIDPSNPYKIAEILRILNSKQNLKIDPFLGQFLLSQTVNNCSFQRTQQHRIKTQNGQRIRNNPKIRDMTNDFDPLTQRNYSKKVYQRVKTQNSPRRSQNKNEKNDFQTSNINNKIYEVFDRRMRRIIRR